MIRRLRRRLCERSTHRTVYDVEAGTLHCRRCKSTVYLREIL